MQIQISHPVLREFFESLQGAARPEQQKFLANAEKLQMILDPQKEYPFDFIVFRLAGRRVRGRLQDLRSGEAWSFAGWQQLIAALLGRHADSQLELCAQEDSDVHPEM